MYAMRRIGRGLFGTGLGFVLLGLIVRTIVGRDIEQPFYLFLDAVSVGIVYVVFGLVVIGWSRVTRSDGLPYAVAVATAGVAIVALLGVEAATTDLLRTLHDLETGAEIAFQLAERPSLWLGYYLAWLVVYNVAATRRQRLLPVAGIAVVPVVTTISVERAARRTLETGGPGAGLGYSAGALVIAACLVAILAAIVYATPLYAHQAHAGCRLRDGAVARSGSLEEALDGIPSIALFLGSFVVLETYYPQYFGWVADQTFAAFEWANCGQPCYLPAVLSLYVSMALVAAVGVGLVRYLWRRTALVPETGTGR